MKLVELAAGGSSPLDGRWLVRYIPDYHVENGEYDGGWLEVTDDPRQARVFRDAEEAMKAWREGPTCLCHRYRLSDGRWNRPLTAWTVCIETQEEAVGSTLPPRMEPESETMRPAGGEYEKAV